MNFGFFGILATSLLFNPFFGPSGQAELNDFDHLPKSFVFERSRKAVFADFKTAHYQITYDFKSKKASVISEIVFETQEKGFPIFDSVEKPTRILVDGAKGTSSLISTPESETQVRVFKDILGNGTEAGRHTLHIETPINALVEFSKAGVKSAFWMTDLKDRGYLERYLPSNFIFDRVKMTFEISFKSGASSSLKPQVIYTNGVVPEKNSRNTIIEFPEGYTASSIYFHTVPQGAVDELRFSFESTDGRKLPSVIYVPHEADQTAQKDRLTRLKDRTINYLNSMESHFGPFLHPSITIYVAGSGGMEYSGALMTSDSALNHELFHSYAARGIMPADGNAGWIDEALAVWWTSGMTSRTSVSRTTAMASQAYFTRTTDSDAYSIGAEFMGFLNETLSANGGLKPFLKNYFHAHKFTPFTTQDFSSAMTSFYQVDLENIFKKYVYDTNFIFSIEPSKASISPEHRQYTFEELENLL